MKPSKKIEISSCVNAGAIGVLLALIGRPGAAAGVCLAVGGFNTGPWPQTGEQTSKTLDAIARARFVGREISERIIPFLLSAHRARTMNQLRITILKIARFVTANPTLRQIVIPFPCSDAACDTIP